MQENESLLGVTPYAVKFPGNTDDMIAESEKAFLQKDIVRKGDSLSIFATSPFTLSGKSNTMKLHRVAL